MIVIIGIWLLVVGYGLAYLGVDRFKNGTQSFGSVFLPGFLSKQAA